MYMWGILYADLNLTKFRSLSYHPSLLPTSEPMQCPYRAHEMLALRALLMAAGQPFQSEKR